MRRVYKSQEVAAKFYAETNIFTIAQSHKPYDTYLPDDFSQKMQASLGLVDKARLGDEQNVMVKGIASCNLQTNAKGYSDDEN